MRGLLRLKEYFDVYRWRMLAGVVLFGFSRVFEASVFFFLGQGIDLIAQGAKVRAATGVWPDLGLGRPASMILGLVLMRYFVVTTARFAVRSAGIQISYDLRQRLYDRLRPPLVSVEVDGTVPEP